MNTIDTKTVMISYIISNAVCAVVMTSLWWQNRRRFAGLGFWLADYAMQFVAVLLVALRGAVPDWGSMVVGNALAIAGTILLYMGLERFVGKRGAQIHNAILLAAFIFVHTYFALVQPSLTARNINVALALIAVCSQCAWLLLRKVDAEMRPITRGVGAVFACYCVINIARVAVDLAAPSGNDLFHSNVYDTLVIMTYQMLFIILTFGLFLMVNRRLFADLERDMAGRQQAEQALKLSEEKFSKAFHSSPDAILISRVSDGKLVEVNEGFCRLSEYSREEAMTSSAIALGIWADPQDRARCVSALLENHSVRDHAYDFRTRSGKILNGLYSGEIIYLGGEAHMLSVVRDITERKQAEAALHESEARYRLTSELVSDYSFAVRVAPDGALVREWATEAYTRITGLPFVEHLDAREDWSKIVYEPDKSIVSQHTELVLRNQANVCEFRIVRPDGEMRWLRLHSKPEWNEKEQRVVRLVGAVSDITAHKRVEEILQLRLRLWEYAATHPIDELMQKALDGIGELTGSSIGFYHFVEADQKTLSLQAWSTRTLNEFCQAEGKGLHYSIDEAGVWVDCVHQRKPVIHNDYAALPHRKGMPAGHAQVIRELVVPTLRDGRVVSILGVGNKPSDYDGQDVEFVSYIADVTWTIVERKRMEDDLHKAKEAAEAANRAKSVFLANMSHELRTPLNAILGFSDLMARDRSLSAEQQENLSIITRSGGHLLSLINDVLDMAKIESGRMTLQEHTFDLYHLLDGMMDLFRARAADKGLTLILNRAPDVPRYVVSDEGKLRQILINLLGNAVKLTEEGGISLRVRAKTKDEGQNTDQAARPSPSVVRLVFEVQDTGPGILPQEIEAIFEPFVQSARGKPTTPGTGLGLAISRQFARLMGGDLIAASVEATGIGALFELDLPVRLADVTGLAGLEQPEKARAIGLAPSQPAYRLLVVEDREENRQLLVKLLTRFGFEVRTAENGLQAIQVWQDWQPHLIWMDMRMPVMDGHEATQRIKAMAQGQSIVIIALTATAFEEDRDLVLAEGCDDFVRKPFHEGEIADKLVKHLGVQFIYEGAAGGPAMPQPPPEALDLAGLPADWVASLRQATMEADADRIMALAEQMREQRPAVASALANLASDFDYAAILSAIQERH